MPTVVSRQVLSDDEEDAINDVEGELDVWADAYCNKHLLYAITELVFLRVLPELGERGVEELIAERLGGQGGGADNGAGAGDEERRRIGT